LRPCEHEDHGDADDSSSGENHRHSAYGSCGGNDEETTGESVSQTKDDGDVTDQMNTQSAANVSLCDNEKS